MSDEVNPSPVNNEDDLPELTSQNSGATGAYVGLNQAVKLSTVSKPTFLKAVKDGKISPVLNEQGKKVYQVIDIERVFGRLNIVTSKESGKVDHPLPQSKGELTTQKIAELEAERQRLQVELAAEREKSRLLEQIASREREEAEKWHKQAERLTLMLPAPTTQPEPEPEKPKGFFRRMFGG